MVCNRSVRFSLLPRTHVSFKLTSLRFPPLLLYFFFVKTRRLSCCVSCDCTSASWRNTNPASKSPFTTPRLLSAQSVSSRQVTQTQNIAIDERHRRAARQQAAWRYALLNRNLFSPADSPLLELRNRIYEYCADDEQLEMPYAKGPRRDTKSFGLTQVCQQVRKEFRSMYMENLEILLTKPEHICDYINIFYTAAETANVDAI